jgi:hypothetical protein
MDLTEERDRNRKEVLVEEDRMELKKRIRKGSLITHPSFYIEKNKEY